MFSRFGHADPAGRAAATFLSTSDAAALGSRAAADGLCVRKATMGIKGDRPKAMSEGELNQPGVEAREKVGVIELSDAVQFYFRRVRTQGCR